MNLISQSLTHCFFPLCYNSIIYPLHKKKTLSNKNPVTPKWERGNWKRRKHTLKTHLLGLLTQKRLYDPSKKINMSIIEYLWNLKYYRRDSSALPRRIAPCLCPLTPPTSRRSNAEQLLDWVGKHEDSDPRLLAQYSYPDPWIRPISSSCFSAEQLVDYTVNVLGIEDPDMGYFPNPDPS